MRINLTYVGLLSESAFQLLVVQSDIQRDVLVKQVAVSLDRG